MNQAHHQPGSLLLGSAPCTNFCRTTVNASPRISTTEQRGHAMAQESESACPALLCKGSCISAEKTKSLCCEAAGIISPSSTTTLEQIPHDRLRRAAPADTTLIASNRPHAQPAEGYKHLASTAVAEGCVIRSRIADAITSTLAKPTGTFATVDQLAEAMHIALQDAGLLPLAAQQEAGA